MPQIQNLKRYIRIENDPSIGWSSGRFWYWNTNTSLYFNGQFLYVHQNSSWPKTLEIHIQLIQIPLFFKLLPKDKEQLRRVKWTSNR